MGEYINLIRRFGGWVKMQTTSRFGSDLDQNLPWCFYFSASITPLIIALRFTDWKTRTALGWNPFGAWIWIEFFFGIEFSRPKFLQYLQLQFICENIYLSYLHASFKFYFLDFLSIKASPALLLVHQKLWTSATHTVIRDSTVKWT